MQQLVNCLYCGKWLPDDLATCPHCGAVSHAQKKGYRAGSKRRFILWFISLCLLCAWLIFYLPR